MPSWQANLFITVNNPARVDFSGDLGWLVASDNVLVGCHHVIETRSTAPEPRTFYACTAHRAAEIPNVGLAGAGVGWN